ncbi:collagen alpha-1(I) chain-like [Phasianus colchicus]|uniref:collagen alpha-1(I) chain-like n=1 Tax=Phasianus colchicus TaxID=9054 RepID=UPI00129DE9F8|nr:collagen alpha-1(I) chain-like [Phasianus colchicus]
MPGSHGSDGPTSDWCTTEGTRLRNVCLPGPQRLWVTLNDANKLETKQKRLQMAQCGVTGPTSLFAESAHATSSAVRKHDKFVEWGGRGAGRTRSPPSAPAPRAELPDGVRGTVTRRPRGAGQRLGSAARLPARPRNVGLGEAAGCTPPRPARPSGLSGKFSSRSKGSAARGDAAPPPSSARPGRAGPYRGGARRRRARPRGAPQGRAQPGVPPHRAPATASRAPSAEGAASRSSARPGEERTFPGAELQRRRRARSGAASRTRGRGRARSDRITKKNKFPRTPEIKRFSLGKAIAKPRAHVVCACVRACLCLSVSVCAALRGGGRAGAVPAGIGPEAAEAPRGAAALPPCRPASLPRRDRRPARGLPVPAARGDSPAPPRSAAGRPNFPGPHSSGGAGAGGSGRSSPLRLRPRCERSEKPRPYRAAGGRSRSPSLAGGTRGAHSPDAASKLSSPAPRSRRVHRGVPGGGRPGLRSGSARGGGAELTARGPAGRGAFTFRSGGAPRRVHSLRFPNSGPAHGPLRRLPAPTPPPPRLRKRRSYWPVDGDCPPAPARKRRPYWLQPPVAHPGGRGAEGAECARLRARRPRRRRDSAAPPPGPPARSGARARGHLREEGPAGGAGIGGEGAGSATLPRGLPGPARRRGAERGGAGRRAAGPPAPGGAAPRDTCLRKGTHAQTKRLAESRHRNFGAAARGGGQPTTFGAAAPPSGRGAAPRRSPVPPAGREERRRVGDGAVRAGKWRRRAALGTPPASRAGAALSAPGRAPAGGGASPALFAEGTAVYVTAPRGRARNRPPPAAQTQARRQAERGGARGPNPVTRTELCRWCACPTAGCTLCKRSRLR